MFLFILLNLCMAFVLKDGSTLAVVFSSTYAFTLGACLLLFNLLDSCLKYKVLAYKFRYDLFAVGALLVWFSYWPAFFRQGSPVFDLYPLYFSLITALFSLSFIRKREHIDKDALLWLQWLSDSGRFNPVIVMLLVIVSLAVPQQFMLFPIAMSLLIMRFALACCLNNE